MAEQSMRDYLEQRERDLETRIAGLEALLCDAQAEADRFRGALQKIAWSDNDGSHMGERHAKCCEWARGALTSPSHYDNARTDPHHGGKIWP